MTRIFIALPLLLVSAHVLAQAHANSLKDVVNPAEAIPQALPKADPAAPTQTPEELAKTADLLLKVAQLMLVRLEGVSVPSPNDRMLLDQIQIGGVILPQLMTPDTVADYVTELRTRRGAGRVPMIIGLDIVGAGQEADPVRVHGMRVPAMLTIAAAGAGAPSAALFDAQASDIARLGADFHWGPSLAFTTDPSRDASSMFTFGSSPEIASALTTQIGDALRERNLAWVPVGFPGGLKNAKSDAPAILVTALPELRQRDLRPYAAAIDAGAELIHVGNTLAPTIDPQKPASMSRAVIEEVLRGALGFEGLVIAGPMDSPDISRIADTSDAAVEALVSGADMIYWQGSGPRVARAIVDIVQAVQLGALPEELVNEKFTRVMKYKERRGIAQWPLPDKGEIQKLTKEARKRPEPAAIEQRAITLLRNNGEVLPLSKEGSGMVGVTGAYGVPELRDALEEYFKSVAMQSIRTARHATRIEDFEINRIARGSPIQTAIVVFSRDIELPGQLKVIRALKQAGKRVVVVLVGFPTNLTAYNDADALMLAYGDVRNLGETMIALAEILMGNAPASVLPPVRELELAAGVEATFDVHDVVRTPVGRLPIEYGPPFEEGYAVSYRSDHAFGQVRWDFGDGKKSSDPIAFHAYKKPGTYTVTLKVGRKEPNLTQGSFQVVVK